MTTGSASAPGARAADRSVWPPTAACAAVVLVLGGFVCFYGLGRFPLIMWDEARLAVNALEMSQSGDLLTTRYEGRPDLWNTKPPLVIWAMAGSMRLLGPTEFAVRLPSALAGLGAALLLLLFCARFLRDPLAGLSSALVLLTSVGFVGEHVMRTGDYDAHLALWTTAYTLALFVSLEGDTPRVRRWALGAAGAAFALAFLAKSVAALLGLPGLFLYALGRRRLGDVLGAPAFWAAALAAGGTIAAYYGLREHAAPGYLATVAANEWVKPYTDPVQGHAAPLWYYVHRLLAFKFVPWAYVLPFAAVAAHALLPPGRTRRAALFGLVVAGSYLLVISLAQTKLPWYDASFYPPAALATGLGLTATARALATRLRPASPAARRVVAGLLLAGVLGPPYLYVASVVVGQRLGLLYSWTRADPELAYGPYLERLERERPEWERLTVVSDNEFNGHLRFYVTRDSLAGRPITLAPSRLPLAPGEAVATCDAGVRARLAAVYVAEVVDEAPGCVALRVSAAAARPPSP